MSNLSRYYQEISDDDLLLECELTFVRSQGPGGQNVNKTNSAVRITHFPTGITLKEQSSRSQLHNRKLALQKLRTKLIEKYAVKKIRLSTKVPKAAKRKRLDSKKHRSGIKKLRSSID